MNVNQRVEEVRVLYYFVSFCIILLISGICSNACYRKSPELLQSFVITLGFGWLLIYR